MLRNGAEGGDPPGEPRGPFSCVLLSFKKTKMCLTELGCVCSTNHLPPGAGQCVLSAPTLFNASISLPSQSSTRMSACFVQSSVWLGER